MVLAMSRPWKHPKTGIFWLRRRVPAHLANKLGKREEKRSLGTRDPTEAKRLFAIAMAEVEVRWANSTRDVNRLTERETDDIARHIFHEFVDAHREWPSEQKQWAPEIGHKCFVIRTLHVPGYVPGETPFVMPSFDPDSYHIWRQEEWCKEIAAQLLDARGFENSDENLLRLAKSVAKTLQAASLEVKRLAAGVFDSYQTSSMDSPAAAKGVQRPVEAGPVPFSDLVAGWASERNPVAKTRYSVDRMLMQLISYLGYDDAARLTSVELLGWKTALLADGISAQTIKATKLGLLKPILRWGFDNQKLVANPAEKVSISTTRKAGDGRRGYTDSEAAKLLAAAEQETEHYLRWVPLICAYTGARISEVCQLRREDIIDADGIWCMRFSPEAGSLKNSNSERLVPVHRKVVSAGFIKFVHQMKAGPLFRELSPDRFGNRGGSGTKLIGRWVRGLGIEDPRISPSHSWRHRFKTLARRHGLALDIVSAMTGHGSKDVAASYGEFEPSALCRELAKLP